MTNCGCNNCKKKVDNVYPRIRNLLRQNNAVKTKMIKSNHNACNMSKTINTKNVCLK